MKIEVEITDETLDGLFLKELINQYELVCGDASRLEVDIIDRYELKKALRKIIKYNMTADEFGEWELRYER